MYLVVCACVSGRHLVACLVHGDERVGIHHLLLSLSRCTYVHFVVLLHVSPLRLAVIPHRHLRSACVELVALYGYSARHLASCSTAHRERSRQKRQNSELFQIGLIGYTNAGKSTLLNKLTGAGILAEDKLFATLDPTTRMLELKDGQQILLTDTVGFIRKLPHHLVEAFKSTLEEAKYADYIIHVVDASNPQAEIQMHTVYETLRELGATGKKVITLLNKQDKVPELKIRDLRADHTVKCSARTGEGLEELKDILVKLLAEGQIYLEELFAYKEAGKIQLIREFGSLLSEEYREDGIFVRARVPVEIFASVMPE